MAAESPALARLIDILRPLAGWRVALVAPAGGVRDDRIDTALAVLGAAGIEARLGAHARDHHRYLAGTADARLGDLHAAFELDDVDAVWCLRGGYGSAHIADRIDWSRIPGDVPLIGYSDITILLEAFRQQGRTGIHGPTATDLAMPGKTETEQAERATSIQSLVELLQGRTSDWPLAHDSGPHSAVYGQLVGGNLTTLASVAGTASALRLDEDVILVLEDVGEAEFRLERSFHQIMASIDRDRLAAVCLGRFEGCSLADGMTSLAAIIHAWLDAHDIPVYLDAPVGHGMRDYAWTAGATARIDADTLRVALSPAA